MLNNLTIQDFVIVDTLDLHFQEGMSVLSGETGAGKSILIDALSLCLGARADAAQVREGCERANITAIFSLNAKARNILEEQSISSNDDELHLRRAIDRNGRSKAYVNGTPVPLSLLKQLAETLIDIHGQHAFQTLTTIEEQMRLLDDFAQLEGPRQAVKNAYLELRKAEKQLASVQQNQEERNERLENLHWRLNLIQKINPQPNLWNQLNIDFDRLSHAAELIEGTQHAAEQLSDAEHAILDTLNAMIDKITHLSARDPNLATVCKHLSEGEIFLREASYELHHYIKHTELDPDALQQLEKQLSDWHETARTLRTPPEALHEELQGIEQDIQRLTTEFDITQLQADQQRAQQTYEQNAKQLSQARQTAAQALSSKITASMQHLNMQGGSFSVDIRPSAPSPWGSDQIEFLVAGHPGVTPQAIQKVASGGELARISLAITINTVQNTTIPTLIFDEVDSGIGGAVAETVGKYLRSLAKNKQVLCVTHLPQVAAQGHHHFKVHKNIEHNHTQSSITALNPEQRIEEIARMLGGKTITAATRTTAQELLNGAH